MAGSCPMEASPSYSGHSKENGQAPVSSPVPDGGMLNQPNVRGCSQWRGEPGDVSQAGVVGGQTRPASGP
jgi:hypothetical protein